MTKPADRDMHLTDYPNKNMLNEHHNRTTDYGKIALICITSAVLSTLLCFTVLFYLMIFVSPILYFLSIGFAGAGIASGNGKTKAIIALWTAVILSVILFLLGTTA